MKITIKNKMRIKRLIIAALSLLLTALIAGAVIDSGLTVRDYTIESDNIKSGVNIRVVEIADLHSQVFGDSQKPLIDIIKAQNPDIIVLAGDIVDIRRPVSGAEQLFEGIKDVAPVYYVSGNHEYWSEKYNDIKNIIEGYGITVLNNEREYITINGANLCICGIDDPEVFKYSKDPEVLKYKDEEGMLKQFSDLGDNTFNILLAHRPEFIESYRKYNFDLVLSGHTHGGEVRLPPFSNGFFAPNQGIFAKYIGGRYDFDNMTMIISRGLATNMVMPRIFDPPEVAAVDIKGK